MLIADRFKELLPSVARIKRVAGESVYWELYDESGALIGYGFLVDVPESGLAVPEVEEFDRYEVAGIVDLDFKVAALDIVQHPSHAGTLWAEDIVEPEFAKQYIGLSVESIKLSPEGNIHAITEATISSQLVTEAIRRKVEHIMRERAGL